MKKRKSMKQALVGLLLGGLLMNLSGCAAQTVEGQDLMEGITAQSVTGKAVDGTFVLSQMDFAVKMFQAFSEESPEENLLISPLSLQLALAMTANGANGKTREEMEQVLGGDISLEDLNAYLYTYTKNLPSAEKYEFRIANSIWFRDEDARMDVKESFLQTNADYYGAAAYRKPFDHETVKEMNRWVKENTDDMIDQIINELPYETVMVLLNAVAFDAEWSSKYESVDVSDGVFTGVDEVERKVEMMYGVERKYLVDEYATGFIKNYAGGKYSFIALLPNEGVSITDYVAGLTPERLMATLQNPKDTTVYTRLPKFSYEYELSANDILRRIGMPTAFGAAADFSKMATVQPGYYLYIGNVQHKTFIDVTETGTRAAAVTSVEMSCESAEMPPEEYYYVTLDRPFVYGIVDTETMLPIFIGTVMNIGK